METFQLIQHTWHEGRESFEIGELELLVGKLGQIRQAYRPVYHLIRMMYTSVAFALCERHEFLASTNQDYQKIVKEAKQKALNKHDAREIRFATGQAAQKIHACDQKYCMPESLKEEISFMMCILMDNGVCLSTPLGHIFPHDFKWEQAVDLCKGSGGGWSADLLFW